MSQMTDVRRNLAEFLEPLQQDGLSLRQLSRRLGRNDSYLQQYLSGKKSPRKLAHEDKLALHALIGIPLEQLGLDASTLGPVPHVGPAGEGDDVAAEDADRRTLAAKPGTTFRIVRNTLSKHPLGLRIGDILVFATSAESIAGVRSEQVILVAVPPGETTPRRLLLRQFVRPALAITNCDGENEALALDRPIGIEPPRIAGVLTSIHREP